jgi:glycosyltransferase involved in cell wall biosynthesis
MNPGIALIINTYNAPDYLSRVLKAVSRQTLFPEEVLLADDGSGEETREVFAHWAARQSFRTEHVRQKNEGFRRSRILNQAIAKTKSAYLVFLDGDTIPHPEFIADHRGIAREGFLVQGHRALLGQAASRWFGLGDYKADRRRALCTLQIEGWKHAFRWPWPQIRIRSDLRGIRGCNLAIWRADMVCVNGYNEAFIGWGREDSELVIRLLHCGIRRLDVRGRASCTHLWHAPASRQGLAANEQALESALASKARTCATGLSQHLPSALAHVAERFSFTPIRAVNELQTRLPRLLPEGFGQRFGRSDYA